MKRWKLCLVVMIAACSGKGSPGPGGGGTAGGGTAVGSGSAGAVDDRPLPPATPRPPPARVPVVGGGVADGWWTKGAAACPAGAQLDGAAPPKDTHVRCITSNATAEGPEAYWTADGKLVSTGNNVGGWHQGVWVSYFPDGTKHVEGSYLHGERHGTWTEWHPSGKVYTTGAWVDGRADGEHVWYSEDGKEVGRVTMKLGTGTWTTWRSDGTKFESYGYVDGVAHGAYQQWYASGQLATRGRFVDGNADGTETEWDEQGHKRQVTRHRKGDLDGAQTTWDEHGRITLIDTYEAGEELSEIRYRDGKPLATVKPTACDTKAGLTHLLGENGERCVVRAVHFPGLVVTGSFAYDRGCMPSGYVLDCKVKSGAPDPHAALLRAGWTAGAADDKQALALALVSEVLHRFDGSISSEPAAPKVDLAADGSAVVTYWLQDPSGMVRGWTRHLTETRISADGQVSEKELRTESGGQD